MIVEIHDMRRGDGPNGYRFIGEVELSAVPRVGETFHHDGNDAGFTVKAVLHTPGRPAQVRGW